MEGKLISKRNMTYQGKITSGRSMLSEGKLIFKDGTEFVGKSFGANVSISGEMVFSTGMVGYPESFTDPSYFGQILVLTYPIIGSYGVPDKKYFESDKIQISGLVVSNYIDTPSHFESKKTLAAWLKSENIPALEISDTRKIAQHLRDKGAMLGKIIIKKDIPWYDPNKENIVAKVSPKKITRHGKGRLRLLLFDCGSKRNILATVVSRGVEVLNVPWNFNPFDEKFKERFDAIIFSNGPGDPKMAVATIATAKEAIGRRIPILGVCLGNQVLALAAGGDTAKLKFGHRSQNQPCIMVGSDKCFITTQNHGFEVSRIPKGFKPWFVNANDGSNEGIIHESLPFMSVQFHPEATPGPKDTDWIFDFFIEKVKGIKINKPLKKNGNGHIKFIKPLIGSVVLKS